ncbi:MAG: class I SAM-dependent methyltransferase family protein [Thermoplasmata archaeon]|nr:class I SAM-dependent methyltransferase family protein [Thermoplasmata archaeon]
MAKAIAVERKKAEEVRKKLIEEGLLIQNLKIKRSKEYVYFPVREHVPYGKFIQSMEFDEKEKNYTEVLKSKGLPLHIPIDFIGDIAILRLPSNVEKFREEISKILLRHNRHIKVVCLDKGIKDEYRIRNIEIIAGEKRTETMHIEYGIKMSIDISKVYFSPRLAGERMRVAKQIKEGSIVIDMFTGAAPFSLVIGKYSNPKKIYGIDINPFAIKYAKANVSLNKLDGIIEIIEGDAMETIKKLPHANHIIMNLPHKSFEFLPYAIEKGDVIHYYEIIERGKEMEKLKEIKKLGKELGYKIDGKIRIIGGYSSSKNKVAMDLFIRRMQKDKNI